MQQLVLYILPVYRLHWYLIWIKYSIMWRHMQDIVSVIVWSVSMIFIIAIIIIIHHIATTIICATITLTVSLLASYIKDQGYLITIFMNHTQDLKFYFLMSLYRRLGRPVTAVFALMGSLQRKYLCA